MLSCVALRLACMCGRATFAMVVSSTCSRTAIITPIVTMIRSAGGSGCAARCAGVPANDAVLVPEVDGHSRRKAGDQGLAGIAVEGDPYRNPLRDLHPIAVSVLRRK